VYGAFKWPQSTDMVRSYDADLTLSIWQGFELQNPPCRLILRVQKKFEKYGISCDNNTKFLHTIAVLLLYLMPKKLSTYRCLESDTTGGNFMVGIMKFVVTTRPLQFTLCTAIRFCSTASENQLLF
jgi:hypothetical protein